MPPKYSFIKFTKPTLNTYNFVQTPADCLFEIEESSTPAKYVDLLKQCKIDVSYIRTENMTRRFGCSEADLPGEHINGVTIIFVNNDLSENIKEMFRFCASEDEDEDEGIGYANTLFQQIKSKDYVLRELLDYKVKTGQYSENTYIYASAEHEYYIQFTDEHDVLNHVFIYDDSYGNKYWDK